MLLKILVSITAAVAVTATGIDKPVGVAGCKWSGTAPYCAGECEPGWHERGRSQCGDGSCCWTGSKALCCEDEDAVQDLMREKEEVGVDSCYWSGTAPYCAGECGPGEREIGRSKCGDGACCWTGEKAYCCNDEESDNRDL